MASLIRYLGDRFPKKMEEYQPSAELAAQALEMERLKSRIEELTSSLVEANSKLELADPADIEQTLQILDEITNTQLAINEINQEDLIKLEEKISQLKEEEARFKEINDSIDNNLVNFAQILTQLTESGYGEFSKDLIERINVTLNNHGFVTFDYLFALFVQMVKESNLRIEEARALTQRIQAQNTEDLSKGRVNVDFVNNQREALKSINAQYRREFEWINSMTTIVTQLVKLGIFDAGYQFNRESLIQAGLRLAAVKKAPKVETIETTMTQLLDKRFPKGTAIAYNTFIEMVHVKERGAFALKKSAILSALMAMSNLSDRDSSVGFFSNEDQTRTYITREGLDYLISQGIIVLNDIAEVNESLDKVRSYTVYSGNYELTGYYDADDTEEDNVKSPDKSPEAKTRTNRNVTEELKQALGVIYEVEDFDALSEEEKAAYLARLKSDFVQYLKKYDGKIVISAWKFYQYISYPGVKRDKASESKRERYLRMVDATDIYGKIVPSKENTQAILDESSNEFVHVSTSAKRKGTFITKEGIIRLLEYPETEYHPNILSFASHLGVSLDELKSEFEKLTEDEKFEDDDEDTDEKGLQKPKERVQRYIDTWRQDVIDAILSYEITLAPDRHHILFTPLGSISDIGLSVVKPDFDLNDPTIAKSAELNVYRYFYQGVGKAANEKYDPDATPLLQILSEINNSIKSGTSKIRIPEAVEAYAYFEKALVNLSERLEAYGVDISKISMNQFKELFLKARGNARTIEIASIPENEPVVTSRVIIPIQNVDVAIESDKDIEAFKIELSGYGFRNGVDYNVESDVIVFTPEVAKLIAKISEGERITDWDSLLDKLIKVREYREQKRLEEELQKIDGINLSHSILLIDEQAERGLNLLRSSPEFIKIVESLQSALDLLTISGHIFEDEEVELVNNINDYLTNMELIQRGEDFDSDESKMILDALLQLKLFIDSIDNLNVAHQTNIFEFLERNLNKILSKYELFSNIYIPMTYLIFFNKSIKRKSNVNGQALRVMHDSIVTQVLELMSKFSASVVSQISEIVEEVDVRNTQEVIKAAIVEEAQKRDEIKELENHASEILSTFEEKVLEILGHGEENLKALDNGILGCLLNKDSSARYFIDSNVFKLLGNHGLNLQKYAGKILIFLAQQDEIIPQIDSSNGIELIEKKDDALLRMFWNAIKNIEDKNLLNYIATTAIYDLLDQYPGLLISLRMLADIRIAVIDNNNPELNEKASLLLKSFTTELEEDVESEDTIVDDYIRQIAQLSENPPMESAMPIHIPSLVRMVTDLRNNGMPDITIRHCLNDISKYLHGYNELATESIDKSHGDKVYTFNFRSMKTSYHLVFGVKKVRTESANYSYLVPFTVVTAQNINKLGDKQGIHRGAIEYAKSINLELES